MQKFAFVSRHEIQATQLRLAVEKGIELVYIGDRDAFQCSWLQGLRREGYDGVVVVHPQAAMSALANQLSVGVFENSNRAPAGEPPRFEAKALHVTEPFNPFYPSAS